MDIARRGNGDAGREENEIAGVTGHRRDHFQPAIEKGYPL